MLGDHLHMSLAPIELPVQPVFDCSLRPRASSSSSQSERSTSPLVISSTHSLETMPRFALSTDDEGKFRLTLITTLVFVCALTS